MQTQVEASAAQVLAVRGVKNVDLDALLWHDRALLKTWAMRGTLHLLPAAEWRTWIAVMRTREWRITPGWEKYHGITKAELEAVTDAIPEALAGDPLTRDELADRIAAAHEARPPGRGAAVGVGAGLQARRQPGPAVPGPAPGKATTFTSPERGSAGVRASRARARPRRGGRHRAGPLPRRQRPGHPRRRRPLAGRAPKAARVLLAAHADELVEVDVDGPPAG